VKAFTARRTVVLLTLALAYYVALTGVRAVDLLRDRRWAFRGIGLGLLLVAFVGVLLVVGEIRFGLASQRLARLAGDVGEDFDEAKAAVEAAPDDWRAWYALAVAYDAGRDPKRGRAALRRAITLERAAP
jgi:hypothetical protein